MPAMTRTSNRTPRPARTLARTGRLLLVLAALMAPLPASAAGEGAALTTAVAVDPGATRKLCQVIGETDRQRGIQTVNATESRFGVRGTDLGFTFEHKGRLALLFGDTMADPALHRPPDQDFLAFSESRIEDGCVALDVPRAADGGYRPLIIPGVDGGMFSVPTGGFSLGGHLYVIATTGHTPISPMARSVLARSDDDGRTFRNLFELSSGRFINVAPAVVRPGQIQGLPVKGEAVLLWGSGVYRRSAPYLAVASAAGIDEPAGVRYFAGTDPRTGAPRWSAREADGAPLFEQSCLGELSVAWNPDLGAWTMLYNCAASGGRNRIMLRAAPRPWGPWTPPQVVFDPEHAPEACPFLNPPPSPVIKVGGEPCRVVADPNASETPGDPYAPALIPRFTRGVPGVSSEIRFLMSTWNPYAVVLMSATVRLGPPATDGTRDGF